MDVRDCSSYMSNVETAPAQGPLPTRDIGASAAQGAASSLKHDSSQISSTASSLMRAMQLPDVREERIAELQRRISAGNYQVSSHDVADAILRSVAC